MTKLVYLVVKCNIDTTVGVFNRKTGAIAWMDKKNFIFPDYTIQTWVMNDPEDGYEEWI